jgi:hypothetical protein
MSFRDSSHSKHQSIYERPSDPHCWYGTGTGDGKALICGEIVSECPIKLGVALDFVPRFSVLGSITLEVRVQGGKPCRKFSDRSADCLESEKQYLDAALRVVVKQHVAGSLPLLPLFSLRPAGGATQCEAAKRGRTEQKHLSCEK